MKTLVIYDNTGRINATYYGETEDPQGIPCLYEYIPTADIIDCDIRRT